MARLIDADRLQNIFYKFQQHSFDGRISISNVLFAIDKQSTAYDVDKVVKELIINGKPLNPDDNYLTVKEAINIVRDGCVM